MDSLKKFVIASFSNIPSFEGLEKNKLVLATPAGIIFGTPVYDEESTEELPLTSFVNSLALTYRKEHDISDDTRLEENDGFLYLKDVTIQNGVQRTNLPYMCVFYDQIIGVSIGNMGN